MTPTTQEEPFERWEHLYGKPVSVNDRFETVVIWDENIANVNKGKWTPAEISSTEYQQFINNKK